MELLSPAGNYESFIGAINAGADAVYLAGSSFGARAYADNFSDEEILKAINYAHLFNKKVYLTVNTLIKEKEFSSAIDFVRPFYLAGLDGVIIQDIGLITAFKKIYPKLELHASTQCFITGVNSAEYFKSLGCCRVVLARELGLKEAIEIKEKTGLEIETFIHGSMCYSYSGDCLFSSCLGQRSGNRGRCAGPCRLSYDVYDSDKNNSTSGYYLSMKDQCTLNILPKLIEAGIDSLKIEGRMKKAEYSAYVTSIYRKYIDLYKENPNNYKVSQKDLDGIKATYLRSHIQEGYYERIKGKEMISIDSPSYNGSDDELMNKIRNRYLLSQKKVPVSVYVYIAKDEKLLVTLSMEDEYVTLEGPLALKAQKAPVTDETITKCFSKLGDTFFGLENITVDNDNDSFISVGELNELRRNACRKLEDLLLKNYRRDIKDINIIEEAEAANDKSESLTIISVMKEEQLKAVMNYKDSFTLCINSDLLDAADAYLTDDFDYIIELPYVLRKRNEEKTISILKKYHPIAFLCHNLEEVSLMKKMGMEVKILGGPEVYNWNRRASDHFDSEVLYKMLPYELNSHELAEVISNSSIITLYGRVPLMVSENCIQRTAFSCRKKDNSCFSHMTDRKNVDLPVYLSCKNCYNVIYNAVRTSLHEFYLSGKIKCDSFMLSFTNESYDECLSVIEFYAKVLKGERVEAPFKEFTKSYYNKGVE